MDLQCYIQLYRSQATRRGGRRRAARAVLGIWLRYGYYGYFLACASPRPRDFVSHHLFPIRISYRIQRKCGNHLAFLSSSTFERSSRPDVRSTSRPSQTWRTRIAASAFRRRRRGVRKRAMTPSYAHSTQRRAASLQMRRSPRRTGTRCSCASRKVARPPGSTRGTAGAWFTTRRARRSSRTTMRVPRTTHGGRRGDAPAERSSENFLSNP